MDKNAILNQFGYFKGISDQSREILAEICLDRSFAKKEIIFTEGEKGYAIFCCISGAIQLFKSTSEGKEVVIKVIKPGEIFGEVILFESDIYPATAIALSRSQIFIMPKHQFFCLLERPDFRNDFISVLMRKQRYLADQIKYLTTYDVEDRLILFLRENYGIKLKIRPLLSKKALAAAIATTPETLSRILQRLKNENLLHWENNFIFVNESLWERRL